MTKNIIIISLIFFLANCGFTPIYFNNTDVSYSIERVDYTGNRELNNFLKINLEQYKNEKIDNKIFIEVESKFEKIVLTKDGTGKATNYQLKAEVIFLIKPTNRKIKITEKKKMSSMNDKFEETRFIKSTKQSFASLMSNKLISELVID